MSESTVTTSIAQELLVNALADMEQWEDVWMEIYTRGVTGQRGSSVSCPVANYLTAAVGETVSVRINTAVTMETFTLGRLPENVTRFIEQFDWHRHPELERS